MLIPSYSEHITRIAPTPSGYIHKGNALNFILTYALARHIGAKIELRIDDIDSIRTREEYIDDIFNALEWLEIDWDMGAKNKQDFLLNHSFANKHEYIFARLSRLRAKYPKLFYACQCSRGEINGVYHGKCRDLGLTLKYRQTSLRLKIEKDAIARLGDKKIDLYQEMGDITLWRKEGISSYQLASLLSDEEKRTTLIVRGEDLINSSAIQFFMAKVFGFESFLKATFIHHPLIFDKNGKKMSKSNGADAILNLRKSLKTPDELFKNAAFLIGIKNYKEITSKDKLLLCKNELDEFMKRKVKKFSICDNNI